MKKTLVLLASLFLFIQIGLAGKAQAAEPGRAELKKYVNQAAYLQDYKFESMKPYSKSQVRNIFKSHFTDGYINDFFNTMAYSSKGKSGVVYRFMPATDDPYYLEKYIPGYSWTADTKVSYSRTSKCKYITISEYYEGDELFDAYIPQVKLMKGINDKGPYKIYYVGWEAAE